MLIVTREFLFNNFELGKKPKQFVSPKKDSEFWRGSTWEVKGYKGLFELHLRTKSKARGNGGDIYDNFGREY